ncbi:LCP family protein [Clostridium saudiense]|uniref:LCP family protein n=1 Tax=Clostridium saudiense TaxID=1414720 RepID=A0ABS2FDD5_9CLOT|nr:LCP family protein [Clostridium saudiense]
MRVNKDKKKYSLRNRIIISTISIVLAVVVGVVIGYYSYVKSKIYAEPSEIEVKTVEKKNEEEVDYEEVEGITNVLLVGTDARDLKESARADSIIIATLDNNNKEIRLTSLFRDTLVDIDGYGPYKLNAAMAFGGINLLKDTIQETYNINIDKYIIINFWGFEAIIDQMGGLEIDVKDYQLDELNKYIGESTGGNDCPVTESGLQLLNGKQALSYARIRKGVGDEFERTERQREVLFKVAEKLRETKPTKYLGIMNSMLDYINTNIDLLDALNMAYTIYKFPSLETKQIHIPVTELADDMNYGGEIGWVFIMDREQNTEILHDFIFNGIEPDESKFDYNSLREALNEYKTGEWIDEYESDYENSNSDNNIDYEKYQDNNSYEYDEEYIDEEWE